MHEQMINETIWNRVFITAAIFCIITGAIVLYNAITRLKEYWNKRLHPQKMEAAIYFDAEMAIAMARVIPAAGVVADNLGNIVYVNQQLLDIFHWREDEMIGKNLTMMIKPEGRDRHNAGMEEWRKTGFNPMFNKPMQVQCLMKGDIEIPVEITIKQMIVHNKPFVVGKIRDIRKQLEQMEEIKRDCNKENGWLRKEVDLYREIEKESCGGMMKWIYSKDRVIMSKGMQSLFGLYQPECYYNDITDKLKMEDRAVVANTIIQAVEQNKDGYVLDFRLLNGRHIILNAGIRYNKDKKPLFVYAVMYEVGGQ